MCPEVEVSQALGLQADCGIHRSNFYTSVQTSAHENRMPIIRAPARLAAAYIVFSGSLPDYRNPGHLIPLQAEITCTGLKDRLPLVCTASCPHTSQPILQSKGEIGYSLFKGWSRNLAVAKALDVSLIPPGIELHRKQRQQGGEIFFNPLGRTALADCAITKLISLRPSMTFTDHESAGMRHRTRVIAFTNKFKHFIGETHCTRPHPQP